MLQLTLGYDTVIRRTWVMSAEAADSNFALKIAAKPLHIDMDLTNNL